MICGAGLPTGDGADDVVNLDPDFEEGDVLLGERIVGADNSKGLRDKDRVRPLTGPKDMTAEQ